MSKSAALQVVVFLTDGRPGDIAYNAGSEETLYEYLDSLQQAARPGQLHFHAVGFGTTAEDSAWIRKMASVVDNGQVYVSSQLMSPSLLGASSAARFNP